MYKTVLLTQAEIAILETIVRDSISSKTGYEERNLTIILNRLREQNPPKSANQLTVWDTNPQINQKSKRNGIKMTENERGAILWCYNIAMVFADEGIGDITLENENGEQFSLKETIEGLLGELE